MGYHVTLRHVCGLRAREKSDGVRYWVRVRQSLTVSVCLEAMSSLCDEQV